jgi:hypothetical protein
MRHDTPLHRDIELLTRAAGIAGKAIWPEQANIVVPPATFEALAEEILGRRGQPVEYRLIGDEAVFLMQAAKNVTLHREDGNAALVQRWTRLAELLRAAVALDLENARKSLGGIP